MITTAVCKRTSETWNANFLTLATTYVRLHIITLLWQIREKKTEQTTTANTIYICFGCRVWSRAPESACARTCLTLRGPKSETGGPNSDLIPYSIRNFQRIFFLENR